MTPSLKAVLARFNGDAAKARAYCVDIAARYPRLAVEYSMYFNLLGGARWSPKALKPGTLDF